MLFSLEKSIDIGKQQVYFLYAKTSLTHCLLETTNVTLMNHFLLYLFTLTIQRVHITLLQILESTVVRYQNVNLSVVLEFDLIKIIIEG
jgi:hypothetical protein